MWVAYILFCHDIELACDERVVSGISLEERKGYSYALLSCHQGRRVALNCPLAFGETDVKERVRAVLNYRKPVFFLTALAIVLCAVIAICFLTDTVSSTSKPKADQTMNHSSDSKTAQTEQKSLKEDKSDDNTDLTSLYKDFITDMYKDEPKISHVYMAIVGKEHPVLLISQSLIGDSEEEGEGRAEGTAVSAEVYQYSPLLSSKHSIVWVGQVESTGSGYPLLTDGEGIISGFHHRSDRLVVNDGVGTIERVEGFGLDKDSGTYSILSITNGDGEKEISSETKDMEDVESMDYYTNTLEKLGESAEIQFHKVELHSAGNDIDLDE